MSLLAIADLHLHEHKEFSRWVQDPRSDRKINSRLLDELNVLYNLVESSDATTLVVLGDVFHVHGVVTASCYQPVYDFFKYVHSVLNIFVVILTGNHDQASKDGTIHSVHGLGEFGCVVDKASWVYSGDYALCCVPYMRSHDQLLEALEEVTAAKVSKKYTQVLCMHAGVEGATVGPIEYRIKEPLKLEELPQGQFAYRLLGHYHAFQKLDKTTLYVGSPVQHNRGERGTAKYAVMLKHRTQPEPCVSLIKLRLYGPEFHSISLPDVDSNLIPGYYDVLGATAGDLEGVIVPDGVWLKPVPPQHKAGKTMRIDSAHQMTDEELLKKYVKHVVPEKEARKALLSLGLELLGQVSTGGESSSRFILQRLTVQHFLSIESIDLKLHRPGSVIAVVGENQDAEGFESNGTGKSSLLPESLYWCLFGEVARKIPAADVVHNKFKKDCVVTIKLLIGNAKVTVTRYRKCKSLGGDGLACYVNGACVTRGTVAETQKLLDGILGVDFNTFSSVIAFSPENLRFVASTDATQKQVLDSILHTQRFSQAQTLVKESVRALKTSTQKHQEGLSRLEGELETLRRTRAQQVSARDTFLQKVEEETLEKRGRLTRLQDAYEVAKAEVEEQHRELSRLAKAIKKHKIDTDDLRTLQLEQSAAYGQMIEANSQVQAVENTLREVQSQIDQATEMIGKPCPTCGQEMKHLGKLIASATSRRTSASELRKSRLTHYQRAKESHTLASESLEAARAAWELKQQAEKESHDAAAHLNAMMQANRASFATIRTLKESLAVKPQNPYAALLKTTQGEIKEATTQLSQVCAQLEEDKQSLALYEFWSKAFGNGGLKNFLLENLLPDMAHYANLYASKLAEGITIDFDIQTTDSGNDKFRIKASNASGADLYAGNSSGERRRIDLCVMLALFRVANSRCRVNLLVLDEVFDTLDRPGLENTVELLHELAQTQALTVFVTSHVGLTDLLEETLMITKLNGCANLAN